MIVAGGGTIAVDTRSPTGVHAVTPEEAVRAYYAAYSEGRPERFDEVVSPDYLDYGHTPPGRGPQGARDDYEHAVQLVGGVPRYDIDALVARDDDGTVAVSWTGHLPSGTDVHGLSLYRVADGQVTEARHKMIGPPPA
jgi:ketosteroid isomerase-like protein